MRLRRGARAKGDRGETRAADTTSAVPPEAIEPETSETAAVGSVLGLHTLARRADRPAIDEWGLYDPEVCGYGALMASLGTTENREAEPLDEDPAELLLRQQAHSLGLPAEVLEEGPAAASAEERLSPAASAVAACRVARFAPLALWAHLSEGEPQPAVSAAFSPDSRFVSRWLSSRIPHVEERPDDDLAALLGRLSLPVFLAAAPQAPGCRIHQIRIAPPPEVRDAEPMPEPEDVVEAPAIRPFVPGRNRVAMALG